LFIIFTLPNYIPFSSAHVVPVHTKLILFLLVFIYKVFQQLKAQRNTDHLLSLGRVHILTFVLQQGSPKSFSSTRGLVHMTHSFFRFGVYLKNTLELMALKLFLEKN